MARTTGFANNVVVDSDNFTVGRVASARTDPRSQSVLELVVRLSEEARARMGRKAEPHVVIPMEYVAGIRRGELDLDRTFDSVKEVLQGLQRPPAPPP